MTSSARPRVVYILGWGRSGSTLLDNILGNVQGFCSVGELHYLWARGIVANRRCGCGLQFRDCPQWGGVMTRLKRDAPDAVDGVAVKSLHDKVARSRSTPLLLSRRRLPAPVRRYQQILRQTYAAILAESGASIVVDSSKRPSEAAILLADREVDSVFVHIVRDPRAVAFSWQRVRATGDPSAGSEMVRRSATESSTHWLAWNAAAELIGRRAGDRYVRVRYEDLVTDPRGALVRILTVARVNHRAVPEFPGGVANLAATHSVSGNPSRFGARTVRLRLDEEWRSGLPRWQAAVVVAICGALMPRYGYLPGSRARAS
jgi:hypothetical protein